MLGRPVAQWALVQAIVRLRNENDATGSRMSLIEACNRINQLDWSSSEPRWQQVLMNGDRVLAGKSDVNFASQIIAYWLGDDLNDEQVAELRERFKRQGDVGELADPIELA